MHWDFYLRQLHLHSIIFIGQPNLPILNGAMQLHIALRELCQGSAGVR